MAYNRFRYYSTESGTYISQDPIGLKGGMPNMYAYVKDVNVWVDSFGLTCSKTFKELVGSKKFRQHFRDHKELIEGLTGKKYLKFKKNSQEFLDDIKKLIDDGVLEHFGEGTLKKDQPIMNIFKNKDVTVVIKDLGGGMDLGIMFL